MEAENVVSRPSRTVRFDKQVHPAEGPLRKLTFLQGRKSTKMVPI